MLCIKIMKRNRVSIIERRGTGFKQNQTATKETDSNKSESNEENHFSEYGHHKKQQGTEGERKNNGRTKHTSKTD